MFVRVDLVEVGYSALAWIPYSAGLVSFDGTASSVPEGLIQAIRRRVEQINAAGGELLESLHKGDQVVIEEGPFAGYKAIFARRSGCDGCVLPQS
jgi:transcriptional antiterminator RfaH